MSNPPFIESICSKLRTRTIVSALKKHIYIGLDCLYVLMISNILRRWRTMKENVF
jgi:hypothetical protein